MLERYSSACTSSIYIDEQDILLIDFEYIIADLYPETSVAYHNITYTQENGRDTMQVVFVEDSSFIRNTITSHLKTSCYVNLESFENGLDASQYIQSCWDKTKTNSGDITD